jgi:class 3 adenylate cyclase/predicted ATPase
MNVDTPSTPRLEERHACPQCRFVNPGGFRYCGDCGALLAGANPAPRQAPERRQLTVLFCDMIGSTQIAGRLDPEDFRDVTLLFQSTCAAIIDRFGGTVSRYMGDGILALFGYPLAHEDDAGRATLAGLGIVEAVSALRVHSTFPDDENLAVRVGIATGLVVVGDIIGVGASEEAAVVGETPNVAARLQTSAAPNSVMISEATRALLGARFDCAEPVSLVLRGYAEPVRAFQVRSAHAAEMPRQASFTSLVDRKVECAWLERQWRKAASGRGGSILVYGEPGIGKSRIVSALHGHVSASAHAVLRFQCSPHYTNTALHPVSEQIALASGIDSEDPDKQKLASLAAWLGAGHDSAESLALLAPLFSIAMPDDAILSAMSAQRRRERTLEVLMGIAERRAAEQPLLILFEDLHWSDPTTRELLTVLVERALRMRVLVVMTARMDFAPPWAKAAPVERLELRRFVPEETMELVARVAGEIRILDSTLQQMVTRADGIPLFIEELTKVMMGGEQTIPATLQDSLMARLDRLGEAKQIAQIAGALGREFAHDLLAAVAGVEAGALQDGLRTLEAAGLIRRLSGGRVHSYAFKHALIQEAAYQSLLRRRRRELHGRIAQVLETQFPGIARDTPELLAYHWTEADNVDRATHAWLVAGRRASERSQYREAIGHLRKGLELTSRLADGAVRHDRELDLLLALGPALITTEGGGTQEVADLYARALDLCEGAPASATHFTAHWGWWRASMNHSMGRERADKLLTLAHNLGDPELLLQGHHCQWATLYMLGAHRECQRHVEAGLGIYNPARDHTHAALYGGHDARVCGLGEGALVEWMLGFPGKGLTLAQSALSWSGELSHVGSRVHAMDYALVLHKFRRDIAAVHRQADQLAAYATEQRLHVHRAKGAFFRGWARAMAEDVPGGLADMLDGIASEQASDTRTDFTLYYEMLAEVYARAGRLDEAIRVVGEAFVIAQQHGIVFWNAELYRRRGEVLRAAGDRDGAEVAFQDALACARGQESRALELRAAVSLSRLHLDEGSASIAHTVLHPLYVGFSEGQDTHDLREASALYETAK